MNSYTSSDFLMCFGTGAIEMESVQMDFSFFDMDVHYSPNAGKIIGFDCLIMLLEIASNTFACILPSSQWAILRQ